MKLTYFQNISPDPVYIPKVGSVISPTLKDIFSVGESIYQTYLNVLLMDTKDFYTISNRQEEYNVLSDDEKLQADVYDLLTGDVNSAKLLEDTLNFFIKEDVCYESEYGEFSVKGNVIVKEQNKMVEKYLTIGIISKDNYRDVVDVICQRNNIKNKDIADPSKVKNKKALDILQKIKKGAEKMAKATKADDNMELGNIISAVANRSQSLNIINIWELTIFQLWDSFARLTNNNAYDINAASVSAWGDKDKKFDFNGWFKKLNN